MINHNNDVSIGYIKGFLFLIELNENVRNIPLGCGICINILFYSFFTSFVAKNEILCILLVSSLALLFILYDLHLLFLIIKEFRKVFDEMKEIWQRIKSV